MKRRLMRAEEVATLLDMSRWRVYKLTRDGVLPHVRIKRQLRYDPKAIQEFIDSGGTSPAGEATT